MGFVLPSNISASVYILENSKEYPECYHRYLHGKKGFVCEGKEYRFVASTKREFWISKAFFSPLESSGAEKALLIQYL